MRVLATMVGSVALICVAQAAPVRSHHPEFAAASGLATDFSAAKRRRREPRIEAAPRYRHGPGTIACTRAGCNPVPPGCHAVRERTVDDSPSGFQIIVC